MIRKTILIVVMGACLVSVGQAAEMPHNDGPSQNVPKKDMPMTTRMKKDGMMQGDVESAADKKEKKMQPVLKQEEKSMPPETPNQ